MNNKIYIGITLGPIDRILNYSKSTRAIWASSYMFSYIAKHIIDKYYKKGYNFLKPKITKDMFEFQDGVGRFPDQYIFQADEDTSINDIRNECDNLLEKLAENIERVLELCDEKQKIFYYLKQTLRIIIVKQKFTEEKNEKEIIESLQDTLAGMECRDTFCAREKRNYLAEYFESTSSKSLLYTDGFGDDKEGRLFNTIIECSAGKNAARNLNATLNDLIKGKLDEKLEPYQKYITFVSADGDNFGKTLSLLGKKVKDVFDRYNKKINEIVSDYGGQIIYQGGDDILFFAPVYNASRKKDIFSLITDIDTSFDTIIKSNVHIQSLKHKPSISYGISVSYHKFPMYEARNMSAELLEKAKSSPNGKNKIYWNVRKHSGQSFGGEIDKSKSELMSVNTNLITEAIVREEAFLHSVTHWLTSQEVMLTTILNKTLNERKSCLKNFIDNSFNESPHENCKDFFDKISGYLLTYNSNEGIKQLHIIMRYIELLIKK